jgi:hypothetical protein
MAREITDRIIEVIVNGTYEDAENKTRLYRVKVLMPDCLDEWLYSNIKSRYALKAILKGKEYRDGKEVENKEYLKASRLLSLTIEETDEKGNDLLRVTDRRPSFYGRSLFTFTNIEIQDFAVAFGLHSIRTHGSIENLRMEAFLEYLRQLKGIDDRNLVQFSFYKYDKTRKKHYIEISEEEKSRIVFSRRECCDLREFREQDEKIKTGHRSISELLDDGCGYHSPTTRDSDPETYSDSPDPEAGRSFHGSIEIVN